MRWDVWTCLAHVMLATVVSVSAMWRSSGDQRSWLALWHASSYGRAGSVTPRGWVPVSSPAAPGRGRPSVFLMAQDRGVCRPGPESGHSSADFVHGVSATAGRITVPAVTSCGPLGYRHLTPARRIRTTVNLSLLQCHRWSPFHPGQLVPSDTDHVRTFPPREDKGSGLRHRHLIEKHQARNHEAGALRTVQGCDGPWATPKRKPSAAAPEHDLNGRLRIRIGVLDRGSPAALDCGKGNFGGGGGG